MYLTGKATSVWITLTGFLFITAGCEDHNSSENCVRVGEDAEIRNSVKHAVRSRLVQFYTSVGQEDFSVDAYFEDFSMDVESCGDRWNATFKPKPEVLAESETFFVDKSSGQVILDP